MSAVPRDPFPFVLHRTMEQVVRTTALQAASSFRRLTAIEVFEFSGLLEKAERHNPPPLPDQSA